MLCVFVCSSKALRIQGGGKRPRGGANDRIEAVVGVMDVRPNDAPATVEAITLPINVDEWLESLPLQEVEKMAQTLERYEKSGYADTVIRSLAVFNGTVKKLEDSTLNLRSALDPSKVRLRTI